MITVDILLDHYKCKNDAELARRCQVTRGAVSQWRSGGMAQNTQVIFQVMSKGRLKADIGGFAHLAKNYKCAKKQA
ncbi:hypothetical protein [Psychrobacter sp.]|uniref:hypothetical protein n=1 Tax=unclassified Psychrobacter TaxID=196806 RepID=UPI003F987CA1